jgi:hypothetical protein
MFYTPKYRKKYRNKIAHKEEAEESFINLGTVKFLKIIQSQKLFG